MSCFMLSYCLWFLFVQCTTLKIYTHTHHYTHTRSTTNQPTHTRYPASTFWLKNKKIHTQTHIIIHIYTLNDLGSIHTHIIRYIWPHIFTLKHTYPHMYSYIHVLTYTVDTHTHTHIHLIHLSLLCLLNNLLNHYTEIMNNSNKWIFFMLNFKNKTIKWEKNLN